MLPETNTLPVAGNDGDASSKASLKYSSDSVSSSEEWPSMQQQVDENPSSEAQDTLTPLVSTSDLHHPHTFTMLTSPIPSLPVDTRLRSEYLTSKTSAR